MAFPVTSVLTSFTGADEDPLSEGGAWAGTAIQNGQTRCQRKGNGAATTLAGFPEHQSWWNVVYPGTGGEEVHGTVKVVPQSGDSMSLYARITNPNNVTQAQAVLMNYQVGTGLRLFEMTAGGTFTQKGSTSAVTVANGERLGLELIGSSAQMKHFTGGSWVNKGAAITVTINPGGSIGIECHSGTVADGVWDDFGGGGIISGIIKSGCAVVGRDYL